MKTTFTWMRWYGYLGLLPFITLSALSLTTPGQESLWRSAFDSYSAVILAFMAGVYWPLSVRGDTTAHDIRLMSIAIGVALLGWFALALPDPFRPLCFSAGFLLLYLIDRFVITDYWPPEYLLMRGHLTLVVVTSQLLLVVGGPLLALLFRG